jgi:hypothetical protein
MIRVQCSHCRAKLAVRDDAGGLHGECPACGASVHVPGEPLARQQSRARAEPTESDDSFEELAGGAIDTATNAYAEYKPVDVSNDEGIPLEDDDDDEYVPTAITFAGNDSIGLADAGEKLGGDSSATKLEAEQEILPAEIPPHLGHLNHYLICDHKDIVARWSNDGKGWMIRLKDGFTRAKTTSTQFPSIGKYILIEVGVEQRDDGLHLTHIKPFRLQQHYALNKLTKAEEAILTTIIGHGDLNSRQRSHVRELVMANFLPKVYAALDGLMP